MKMNPGVLVSTALLAGIVGRGIYRHVNKKKASSSTGTGIQNLDTLLGPAPDPCLNSAYYTEVAQPLRPEIYGNVSEFAQALYGSRPIFFIPQNMQLEVFGRLSYLRANEPAADPVIRVAQELAPNCTWLGPTDDWSPSMVALRNSLEAMIQVQDVDLASGIRRRHSWETEMVLRDRQTLQLKDGDLVSFELPPGSGPVVLSSTVIPSGGGLLQTLGEHDQRIAHEVHIPVIQLRPILAGTTPTTFRLTATRTDGSSTSGNLEILP